MERVEAFGLERINAEKIVLRHRLSDAIKQCDQPHDAVSSAIRHFCDYYKKDEFLMIDELRDAQRKRSIEIISRLKHHSTNQR